MDPMTPSSRLTIPPAWERKITARWKELEPILIIRGEAHLRPFHRSWLIDLLRDDIQMRVVRRLMLDDVREPFGVLLERRRAHYKTSHHPRYTRRANVTHKQGISIQPSPPRG